MSGPLVVSERYLVNLRGVVAEVWPMRGVITRLLLFFLFLFSCCCGWFGVSLLLLRVCFVGWFLLSGLFLGFVLVVQVVASRCAEPAGCLCFFWAAVSKCIQEG